ncbi:MAG: rhomboid family intramembrane serine protease [Spirochaetales bacterium]|nr:rhomboid family intramembrane serine protease [Spirochaetales bacterium]
MPQKFKCARCKTDLVVLKLDIGKFAACPQCGEWNEVPGILEPTGDSLNCKIKKKEHIKEILSENDEQSQEADKNIQTENTLPDKENKEIPEKAEIKDEQQEIEQDTNKEKPLSPDSATHSPQDNINITLDTGKVEVLMTYREYLKQITPHIYSTPLLIIINTLIFLLMSFSGVSIFTPELTKLLPWGIKYTPLILDNNEWWRLFTCMFVHIGIFHLIVNMTVLWIIGNIAERSYGSIAFTLIYLVSGLAGNVASLFLNAFVASAGASGAIMGITGALIPFMINKDLALPQHFTRRTAVLIILISGMSLGSGFIMNYIDNAGHIGGFLAGIGTGFILRKPLTPVDEGERRKKYIGVLGIGVLILITGIIGGNMFLKNVAPLLQIEEHWKNQEYEKALGVLTEHPEILSEVPDGQKLGAVIYGNAGWENYLKGDFERCISLSEKAFEIDPVVALYARYNIALCYLRLGSIKKSRDLYTELENADIKIEVENRNGAIQDLKDLIKQDIHADEAKNILLEIFKLKQDDI